MTNVIVQQGTRTATKSLLLFGCAVFFLLRLSCFRVSRREYGCSAGVRVLILRVLGTEFFFTRPWNPVGSPPGSTGLKASMYDRGGNFLALLSDQIGYMIPDAVMHADPSTGINTPRMEPSSGKTSYAPQPLSICRCAIPTGTPSYVAHPRKVEFGGVARGSWIGWRGKTRPRTNRP